ncbi:protein SPT2 [Arachis ipaensis]|uniref:protein SPT2 n=1 Tax=Arachis ipaensis TaxID=130454 RepID=UPI0007AFC93E|nr:protein SPT2 [Arachis ipaensis]XP_020978401.1 protein SPT2 [Arachis ipaensis]
MRGYDRDEYDDYEGYDDYEDEGGEEYEEEGEEAEYEEERPKPTKEEIEYLELRQKLKESIRKKMKKESSTSLSDSNSRKKLPYDNYGSFFGPSQPVISQRVIEESKSLIGNPDLAARISKAAHVNKNTNKASNGSVKSSTHSQMPKASEKQVKAQKLKVIRDYSFLMSDDAELPPPTKVSPSQNTSIRNNEGRPAQLAGRNKQLVANGGGKHVRSSGEERRAVPGGNRLPPKPDLNHKLSSSSKPIRKAPADSRKQLGSNSGNGPGRPVGPKGLPPKVPASTMGNKFSAPVMKKPVNDMHRPVNGTHRPVNSMQRPVNSMQRPVNGTQKSLPSKVHSSVRQNVDPRRDPREQNRPKMLPKQPVASTKTQINKPLKPNPKHSDPRDHRPKNKGVKRHSDDMEDEVDVRSMIRSMFNYNPNRFVDDDDDDDMEAGFDEIMQEERKSALIARKEDEEQLKLIEAEEERERRRKLAKLKKRRVGE